MFDKWTVWKHNCLGEGMGIGQVCDPVCDDPWQVDTPFPFAEGMKGDTFGTFEEALAYALEESAKDWEWWADILS
jgi:hypothetical protein